MKITNSIATILTSLIGITSCTQNTRQLQSLPEIIKDDNNFMTAPVQVAGVIWLNPLHRRDYPSEWQILWTLGMTSPNKNDDVVKKSPFKFSRVQPIASIADGDKATSNN